MGKRLKAFGSALALGATLALAAPSYAHHNWQAIFDVNADIEVAGEITAVRWRNPHVTLSIRVEEAAARQLTG